MADDKKVAVLCSWVGVHGEKVKVGENLYQCGPNGEMDVSPEDAAILCSSTGWKRAPKLEPVKRTPPPAPPAPPKPGKKGAGAKPQSVPPEDSKEEAPQPAGEGKSSEDEKAG